MILPDLTRYYLQNLSQILRYLRYIQRNKTYVDRTTIGSFLVTNDEDPETCHLTGLKLKPFKLIAEYAKHRSDLLHYQYLYQAVELDKLPKDNLAAILEKTWLDIYRDLTSVHIPGTSWTTEKLLDNDLHTPDSAIVLLISPRKLKHLIENLQSDYDLFLEQGLAHSQKSNLCPHCQQMTGIEPSSLCWDCYLELSEGNGPPNYAYYATLTNKRLETYKQIAEHTELNLYYDRKAINIYGQPARTFKNRLFVQTKQKIQLENFIQYIESLNSRPENLSTDELVSTIRHVWRNSQPTPTKS